jgi:glutamate formiminotransferase
VLADYSADGDHNRSVFTLIGSPQGVGEAAFALAREACRLIDITRHTGCHPRLGAVDVVPFVPLKNITMQACKKVARGVAERIGRALFVPVFLYEQSATCDSRVRLECIRKGYKADWRPDFGPTLPHPTAGVTVVGARDTLIAFNVNLQTDDLRLAKRIAARVRASSGGLPFCKALGVRLADRGIVQVTMNLTDYKHTPIYRAFDIIKAEAEKAGVPVQNSELIGMTPAQALADAGAKYLMLDDYAYDKQVLERFML